MRIYVKFCHLFAAMLTASAYASNCQRDQAFDDIVGDSLKRALRNINFPGKAQKVEHQQSDIVAQEGILFAVKRSFGALDKNPSKYQKLESADEFKGSEEGEVVDDSISEDVSQEVSSPFVHSNAQDIYYLNPWVRCPELDTTELFNLNVTVFNVARELMDLLMDIEDGILLGEEYILDFKRTVTKAKTFIGNSFGTQGFYGDLIGYLGGLSHNLHEDGLASDFAMPQFLKDLGENPRNQSEFNLRLLHLYLTQTQHIENEKLFFMERATYIDLDPETDLDRMSLPKRNALLYKSRMEMINTHLTTEFRLKAAKEVADHKLWGLNEVEKDELARTFYELKDYVNTARVVNQFYVGCEKPEYGPYESEFYSVEDWLHVNIMAGDHEKVELILDKLVQYKCFEQLKLSHSHRIFKKTTSRQHYQVIVDAIAFLVPKIDESKKLGYFFHLLEKSFEATGEDEAQADIARQLVKGIDFMPQNKKTMVHKRCIEIFLRTGNYQEAETILDKLFEGGKMPKTVYGCALADLIYYAVGRVHDADVIFGHVYKGKSSKENRDQLIEVYKSFQTQAVHSPDQFMFTHINQRLKELGVE